jgi:hypothetical protein
MMWGRCWWSKQDYKQHLFESRTNLVLLVCLAI